MNLVTIERHILEQQKFFPEASGELTDLLTDVAFAAKLVRREVVRAGLVDILGFAGTTNVQGEEVKTRSVRKRKDHQRHRTAWALRRYGFRGKRRHHHSSKE